MENVYRADFGEFFMRWWWDILESQLNVEYILHSSQLNVEYIL